MGNTTPNNSVEYHDLVYTSIEEDQIKNIRKNFQVIDVEMLNNEYFIKYPAKKDTINKMLEFYLNDRDKEIYKITEYLCNEKEKICICYTHAEDFRKIYEGKNYHKTNKYISWCKKINDRF
jgi:hypothetical protein